MIGPGFAAAALGPAILIATGIVLTVGLAIGFLIGWLFF